MKLYLNCSFNKADEDEMDYVEQLDKVIKVYGSVMELYGAEFDEIKKVFSFERKESNDTIEYVIQTKEEDADDVMDVVFINQLSKLAKSVMVL